MSAPRQPHLPLMKHPFPDLSKSSPTKSALSRFEDQNYLSCRFHDARKKCRARPLSVSLNRALNGCNCDLSAAQLLRFVLIR
ncbi:hypothetical protein PSTG_07443 [Puccinia striiformis f. sp. tritici PST-78]|uniref:Uncharacterized protein n=1 Tax=Puccinia striiformis f. sp. tritici PST-78 TaxID=1165861 RepID=A0A0L0VJD5_9BASI|nr:hypothetical protein PSTG_07443 [Puccinia striiformis f. sp. tritici PST-78]